MSMIGIKGNVLLIIIILCLPRRKKTNLVRSFTSVLKESTCFLQSAKMKY